MRKILMSFLLMAASGAVKGMVQNKQGQAMDRTKLKMQLIYVKSIETSRLLFMSLFGVGVCLILVLTGITLFHTVLLGYTPWSTETKMWVGFLLAGGYLTIALKMFNDVFAQDRWIKIFHAAQVVEGLAARAQETDNA